MIPIFFPMMLPMCSGGGCACACHDKPANRAVRVFGILWTLATPFAAGYVAHRWNFEKVIFGDAWYGFPLFLTGIVLAVLCGIFGLFMVMTGTVPGLYKR